MPRKNRIIAFKNGEAAIEVRRRNGEAINYKVDQEDIEKVRHLWWFCHFGYCSTRKGKKFWYLHWEILGRPKKGYVIYFLNGDRKDNRKSNLLRLTWSQRNFLLLQRRKPNRSTGIIGVSLWKNGLYSVTIGSGNKRKFFRNREDAIAARLSFEKRVEDRISRSTGLKMQLGRAIKGS